MNIENGKYYMTRGGAKVGPMNVPPDYTCWATVIFADCLVNNQPEGWKENGEFDIYGDESDMDLIIGECEPDHVLTAFDHLRKAAAMFVLAGQDQSAIDVLTLIIDHEGNT